MLYWVIYINAKKKKKKNTLTVPSEKSKTVSFASSIMEETVASWARFLVKVIYCICCLTGWPKSFCSSIITLEFFIPTVEKLYRLLIVLCASSLNDKS